jgi:diguanylate cyclase (GGDEF)-like protein
MTTCPAAALTPEELAGLGQSGSPLLVALQSLVGVSVVLHVPAAEQGAAVATTHVAAPEISLTVIAALEKLVVAWLASPGEADGEDVLTVAALRWQLLMAETRTTSGERVGAVAVARQAHEAFAWSGTEISTVQTFAALCGSSFGGRAPDPALASQTRLDALVTRVAVDFMSVSASSLDESLESMLRVLGEFFKVDACFLRRNDFDRDMTVLVAEWPPRQNVPDPDPLGEVPFGVDPVFDAIRDLKEPFVMRPTGSPDAYQERVQQGSGIDQVSMAMVPLVRDRATVGVVGFVKYGDRPWETAETNALQAVASLMVQLQARVAAEERLAYHAFHDELTNLPNRRALLEELHRRLEQDTNQTTALLFLDLDRFKAMNDFLGHGAGDRLLVTIAERLRDAMGPGDFAARLAGDEFVFLLERPMVELEALAVADKLLELVAGPVEIGGHHISRTASSGISFTHSDVATAEDLLAHADAALHLAKAQGGNRAVVFDQTLRASAQERSETELSLRDAIDHGGLLLYYQPEVNLRTGKLLAVEALVRWDHPQRGVLPAGSFIKVAEETGLIVDLGRWVLAESCRQAAEWREQYPELRFTMRVNMSPAQLATRNIVGLVAASLTENQLPGRALCLEITEHAVMQDVEQAVQVLHDLKALGVSLAIDDFGTGYSSMSQLKRLPVDTLKIDQTFVAGLGIDGGDRAIVDATVRLAQSFGLDVVAEGVETVELVHELLGLGCERAQGYLLCRPKPATELANILQHGGLDPLTFTRYSPKATLRIEKSLPGPPGSTGQVSKSGLEFATDDAGEPRRRRSVTYPEGPPRAIGDQERVAV